jgi:hypothetical protein
MLVNCPRCGTRVLPMADGRCPACKRRMDGEDEADAAATPDVVAPGSTVPAGPQGVSPSVWAGGYLAYTALTFWWVFGYVGPGRWLGDLQLDLIGSYYALVSLLVLHVPGILLLRKLSGGGPVHPGFEVERALPNPWLQDLLVPVVILVVGLVIAAIPWRRAYGDDLGRISVEQAFEADQATYYAEVTGILSDQYMLVEKGDEKRYYRSLDAKDAGFSSAIRVIAQVHQPKKPAAGMDGLHHVRGFVSDSVPGEVRAWLEKTTGRRVDDDARFLRSGVVDRKRHRIGMWLIIAGTLAFATIRFVSNRRARRAAPPHRHSANSAA